MQRIHDFLKQTRPLLVLLLGLAIAGCAGNDEQRTEIQNITEAYKEAQNSIARR